jgi:hypothetical protein
MKDTWRVCDRVFGMHNMVFWPYLAAISGKHNRVFGMHNMVFGPYLAAISGKHNRVFGMHNMVFGPYLAAISGKHNWVFGPFSVTMAMISFQLCSVGMRESLFIPCGNVIDFPLFWV